MIELALIYTLEVDAFALDRALAILRGGWQTSEALQDDLIEDCEKHVWQEQGRIAGITAAVRSVPIGDAGWTFCQDVAVSIAIAVSPLNVTDDVQLALLGKRATR